MGVAVLVGTRKGLFVLTSDETRREWSLEGPQADMDEHEVCDCSARTGAVAATRAER